MSILRPTEALCMLSGFALSLRAIKSLRDSNCTSKKRAKIELAIGLSAIALPILSHVLNPYLFPKFKVEYSCTGPAAALNPETNCATMINKYSGVGFYYFQPGLTDTNGKLECRLFSFGAEECKKTLEAAFRQYHSPIGISDYKIELIS